ncbi:low-density lipoprotein receptor class A domain-containing protein 3-like [Artemia franciscana]|uniref:Ig-like domain-containing protein n=1 Tax=Artemia franciscana TaxID=6661 RepID=A0AA88L157_ARTSF|nr:hypothetical protein QYM36_009888 [Artemia franciscana]
MFLCTCMTFAVFQNIFAEAIGLEASGITNFSLMVNPQPGTRSMYFTSKVEALNVKGLLGDSLNLTCRVAGLNNPSSLEVTHYWNTPELTEKDIQIKRIQSSDGQLLFLTIPKISNAHSGSYVCWAHIGETTKTRKVNLIVQPVGNYCEKPNKFKCHSSECVSERFVCDGIPHCLDESDEAESTCKRRFSCPGRIHCGNERCIPFAKCCNQTIDPSCALSDSAACCLSIYGHAQISPNFLQQDQQSITDLYVFNCTSIIVLGCCLAFFLWVGIFILAVARVKNKQNIVITNPIQTISQYEIEFENCLRQDSLLLARMRSEGLDNRYGETNCNIRNGVSVDDPPPAYSEIDMTNVRNEAHPIIPLGSV